MDQVLRILMLEDAAADAGMIERELRKAKLTFWAKRVETRDDFVRELQAFGPDLILSDYSLPSFDGLAAMGLARELVPATPLIIVTGSLDEETAVECIKSGAVDYVTKEHLVRLGPAVENALERKRARETQDRMEEKLHRSQESFRRIVQTASEGIWVVDVEGGTSFVNGAWRTCSASPWPKCSAGRWWNSWARKAGTSWLRSSGSAAGVIPIGTI